MNYRFLDQARQELIEAGVYYASQNRELVDDLEQEVDRALSYLCELPRAAKPIDRVHRSYKLRRFPYLLIYRIAGAELIIVAVAHASRRPGYWRGRTRSMSRITLILGGARSGKSAYAERLITALPPPWLYCATAQALDDEMRERIAHHRKRRGGGWRTMEAPLNVASELEAATSPILVDCLTLWLTNIMLAGRDAEAETARLIAAAQASRAPVLFVSNEVGLGIVPDNALAREFRDRAGRLNQAVAAIANRVVFMAAGLPMVLKDE